jgi:hypothetical protein
VTFASQSRALDHLRERGDIEIVCKRDDGTWIVKLADGRLFTVYRNGVVSDAY